MVLARTPESRLGRLARRAYAACAVLACLLAATHAHAVVRPRPYTPLHEAFAQIARERGVPLEAVMAEPDRWLRDGSAARGREPLPAVRNVAPLTPPPPIEFTFPRVVGEGYQTPVAGDFDGDGDADLLARRVTDGAIVMFTGDANHPLESHRDVTLEMADVPAAAADLDRDGRDDLLAIGGADGKVGVYRSLGAAGFEPSVRYAAGGGAWVLKTGDLTGDGWTDAALLTSVLSPGPTSAVLTLVNEQNGHLVPGASVLVPDLLDEGALADFDGDGRVDVAVLEQAASQQSRNIRIFRSTAAGGLDSWASLPVQTSGYRASLAAGDLDADGYADIIHVGVTSSPSYAESLVVSHGSPDGGFERRHAYPREPTGYSWTGIADVDGDARADVVLANPRGVCEFRCPTLVVYAGDASGGLQAPVRFLADDAQLSWASVPSGLALADFNGDHASDAVLGNESPARLSLVVSDRAGGFEAPASVDSPRPPWRVRSARVRASGAPDVFVWDGSQTWRGGDVGAYGPPGFVAFGPGEITCTDDLNGDGRDDVVLASGDSSRVYLNDGVGGFLAPADHTGGVYLDCADFDGAQGPDLLVADAGGRLAIRYNDGRGGFGPLVDASVTLPDRVTAVSGFDLDRDGRAELVIGRDTWEVDTLEVRWNLGAAFGPAVEFELTPGSPYLAATYPTCLGTGDFDGNGFPDLLVVRGYAAGYGEFSVLLNAGARTFLPSVSYGFGRGPWEAVAADFDQDGLDDVAVVYDFDVGTGKVRIFHAGFGGVLTEVPASSPGGFSVERYPTSLALGDWDRDDRQDFVVGNVMGRTLTFFRNLSIPQTPVATALSLVSAEAGADGVRLEWHASQPGLDATLERALEPGAWQVLGTLRADGAGRLAWTDATVGVGTRVGYRLSWAEGGARLHTPETWLDVPRSRPVVLAMEGARPNPARGAPELAFTLPQAGAARLEVFDVGGRRVASRDLLASQPGRHVLRVAANAALAPGLYLARLTQAGRTASVRFAVVE